MFLIKERHHTGNNHGALYHVYEEEECMAVEEDGTAVHEPGGKYAQFMGNVVCPSLEAYLADNPDVKVASQLPDDAIMR